MTIASSYRRFSAHTFLPSPLGPSFGRRHFQHVFSVFSIAALLLQTAPPLMAQPQPGTLLWSFATPYQVTAPPALASDGTIYLGTQGALYAITSAAPNKWTFSTGVLGRPAIGSDGTIYFGGANGNLYAVDTNGNQKWSYPAAGGGGSPAIGADGTIYFQGDSYLHAVNTNGIKLWTGSLYGSQNYSSPVVGPDGTIYATSYEFRNLYAFSPEGTQKWTQSLSARPGNGLAIRADGIILGAATFAFAMAPSGTNLWTSPSADCSYATPVVGSDGTAYAGDGNDLGLNALSSTGELLWHAVPASFRGAIPSIPAVDVKGIIYYCTSNNLFALSPEGLVLWIAPGLNPPPGIRVQGTPPVIGSDGTVYVAFGTTLYAIASTNGPASTAWPVFQQNPRHTGRIEKPALNQPKKRVDSNFQFQIYTDLGKTNTIQTSSDLTTWTPLTNILITNLPMEFIDWDASNFSRRFYRALQQ